MTTTPEAASGFPASRIKTAEGREVQRGQLWLRFIVGMAWLAVMADLLSILSDRPFAVVFAVTVGVSLFCSGLALVWLYRWALNQKARERQFGISSLLFATTFTAIYFAGVHWVAVQLETRAQEQLPWQGLAAIVVAWTALLGMTCPFVLWITEALLWFAVWFVRWPAAKRLFRHLLKRPG